MTPASLALSCHLSGAHTFREAWAASWGLTPSLVGRAGHHLTWRLLLPTPVWRKAAGQLPRGPGALGSHVLSLMPDTVSPWAPVRGAPLAAVTRCSVDGWGQSPGGQC